MIGRTSRITFFSGSPDQTVFEMSMIPKHVIDKHLPLIKGRRYRHITLQWSRHANRKNDNFYGYAINIKGDKLYRVGLFKELEVARMVTVAAMLDRTIVKRLGGIDWLKQMQCPVFRRSWLEKFVASESEEVQDGNKCLPEVQEVEAVEEEVREVEAVEVQEAVEEENEKVTSVSEVMNPILTELGVMVSNFHERKRDFE